MADLGNRVPTWVGVVVASVALSLAAVFGVDALGLFSSDTVESPAPTAIDGQRVTDYTDFADYLDTKKAGDRVELKIVRDGNETTLTVTLDAWAQN